MASPMLAAVFIKNWRSNMSSSDGLLDQPRDVRDEERFNVEAVSSWLKKEIPSLQGTPTIKQFSGGASNLTYLISYPDRDLILRRPPIGQKAKGAHDMVREYRVQQSLKPVYPAVPAMLAQIGRASCRERVEMSVE